MQHFTSRGVPMSGAMSIILNKAVAKGFELKSLVHGVRIKGTDVVCSDTWRGLYLCKTKKSGFVREELGCAKLQPTDQDCWGSVVESYLTDAEGAAMQAKDIMALANKKGYLLPLADGEVIEAAPVEEVIEAAPVEEVKAVESPKKRSKRRRKKGKVEAEADKVSALDAAIAEL